MTIRLVLSFLVVSACGGEEMDTYPPLQRSDVAYADATPQAAPQEPRDTFYLHGPVNVRRAPNQQARLVRTVPRGEMVLLGPKDAGGWAPVYDGTSNQPAGYLYRASPAVRASMPSDDAPAPRRFSGASSRSGGGYYRGPRGGCYTYSKSGRKRYVDRSLCN